MSQVPTISDPAPTPSWPRTFLLKIYQQAIEHGCVAIHPISEPNAKSLIASFYRLRRRSDTTNASFITPEHHLVTATGWRQDKNGCVYFMFDQLPNSEALPEITPVDPSELSTHSAPLSRTPLPDTGLDDGFEVPDDFDPLAYVRSLQEKGE